MTVRKTFIFVNYYVIVDENTIGFNDIAVDEYGVAHTVYKTYTEPSHKELIKKEFKWETDARRFADKVKGEVVAYHSVESDDWRNDSDSETVRYRAPGCCV